MEITLQSLLDAYASGEDVAALLQNAPATVDLAALEAEALAAFDAIRQGDAVGDAEVAALETLATAVTALRGEAGRREAAVAETAQRVAALADSIAPAPAADETPAPEAPVDEAPADEAPAEDREPALVAAARPRIDLGRIARRAPAATPPAESAPALRNVLTAAADLPGVAGGTGFDSFEAFADVVQQRFRSLPSSPGGAPVSAGIGVLRRSFPDHLVASGSNDEEVLWEAGREANLPGGSLVAAGGWCAPSETEYGICELEGTDALYSLPEMGITRGGIKVTQAVDFAAVYGNAGLFTQTEAQSIAGDEKPCVEVDCPTFEDYRLDAYGLCIQAGILQNRAYPEYVARFIRGALTAHAHRMAYARLQKVIDLSTDIGTISGGVNDSATTAVLGAIDLQIQDYRTKYRLPVNSSLEVILPLWLRGVIRSDLAKRNGVSEFTAVTDAQIDSFFTVRKANVQWIDDFQVATTDPDGTFGGATAATVWPSEVQVLIYVAGAFVAGVSDVLTVNALYDSTLLKTNKYQALWTEEGLLVARRCGEGRVFTVPICANGSQGLDATVACPAV